MRSVRDEVHQKNVTHTKLDGLGFSEACGVMNHLPNWILVLVGQMW